MKKVTTNITFGQILFILFTFCFASLMFFYLGAKFGPQILEISIAPVNSRESILPDESVALEIQELLNTKKHDFVFQEALASNQTLKQDEFPETKTVSVEVETTSVTKQILQDLKESQTAKTADLAKLSSTTESDFWKAPSSISTEKATKPANKPIDKVAPLSANTKPTSTVATAPLKKTEISPVKVAETKLETPQVVKPEQKTETSEDEQMEEAVSVSNYKLQLGSYSDIKKAQTAVQLWQKRGYSATVVQTKIPGKGNWYRVRIGGYSDMTEAMNAQRLIMRKYRQSVSVVNLN